MTVSIKSEIAGIVETLERSVGDTVSEGDELIILSSMKMEIPILATVSGRIKEYAVAEGDMVSEDQLLVVIEA